MTTRHNSSAANHSDALDSMELLEESQKNGNVKPESKNFDPNEQTWRLFKEQGARLSMTIVFMALIIAALKIFEDRGNVTKFDKRLFNFVITGLSLLLGLGFFDAFKDMAKILRWRILANEDFSLREADLILGGDSLMTLTTLMRESWKKPRTLFVCAFWIFLNIAAQAAIGIIGLTYSMENGIDSTGIIEKNGMINVTKIDCYYANNKCLTSSGSEIVAQGLAHSYGETISGRLSCPYTDESQIQNAPQNCSYFSHTNGQEFAIRYAEYNPDDLARAYPYFTDRIVTASAGECSQYDVIGDPTVKSSNDGDNDTWVWKISKDSTHNETISIPKREAAADSTTYIYYGTSAPPEATVQACGDRCMWLYAWRSGGPLTKRKSAVFKCPINVSNVSNVTKLDEDWKVLPNDIARYAAASIALTGRNAPVSQWQQYRLYSYDSPWETGNLGASDVGALMSKFAIGSLAAMANLNPQFQKQGTLPVLGYSLSVEWKYVIVLAVCVVCVHCILVGLMLWIARSVVVAYDSSLCMARLLEGLVGRLGGRGSLLDEKEIVTAIQGRGGRELRVFYGIGRVGKGEEERVLRLGENKEVEKLRKWQAFPKGAYL